MYRALLAVAAASLLALAGATGASASRVIVSYDKSASRAERSELRQEVEGRSIAIVPGTAIEILDVESASQAAGELEKSGQVRFAEADRRVKVQTNDTYWSSMWALGGSGSVNINATGAWSLSQGSGVTVAVLDTGTDLTHEDLAGRIATNPGESGSGKETNGIDDDGNGYVDDWRGWDWVVGDNLPADVNGHGTHVSGTVAASKDNGKGVTGVAPLSKVMPLRVLGDNGTGLYSNVILAMAYAGRMGAKVANLSLGSSGRLDSLGDVARAWPGTLYVIAAGNDGRNLDIEGQDEIPCEIIARNSICIAASNNLDQKASFSNYGRGAADMFAPGQSIISTTMGNTYSRFDGTSMATPHVAAVAALIAARTPSMTAEQIHAQLVASGQQVAAFSGLSRMGTRLDAYRALTVTPTFTDSDSDATNDVWDNCITTPNPDQRDRDGDGTGDLCDASPFNDADSDGVPDEEDNCPWQANADQADNDRDGQGNVCDLTPNGPDSDSDGVPDSRDNCLYRHNAEQADNDGDGQGNVCDLTPNGPDADWDGVPDSRDNCRLSANPDQTDLNNDGIGDSCQRASSPTEGQIELKVSKKVSRKAWSARISVDTDSDLRVNLQVKSGSSWKTVKTFKRSGATSLKISGRFSSPRSHRLQVGAVPGGGISPALKVIKLR